jgi:hypothetical protein
MNWNEIAMTKEVTGTDSLRKLNDAKIISITI